MKYLLIILSIFICCKEGKTSNLDLTTMSLRELTKLGYELRDDSSFIEICGLLNDSILIKNKSMYMDPIFWIEIIDEIKNTHESHVGYSGFTDDYDGMDRDAVSLYVFLKNDSMFINGKYHETDKVIELAEKFIFHDFKDYGSFGKRKYKTRYFGEMDVSIASITLHVSIKTALSVNEWKFLFNSLHKIFSVFERLQNDLALKTWGKNFNTLCDEEKVGTFAVFPNNVRILFDMYGQEIRQVLF